jgi:3-oxoacyl-[acyl-carrier protein] reductase
MKLKDQVALVTGGSRGIGRAIVQIFAAEGAKVAVIFRGNKEAADSLVSEVKQAGGVAMALQADVTDAQAAERAVEQVTKEWKPIDILVNNAGIIHDDLFVRLEPDAWNKVLATNLGGRITFAARWPTR